MISPNIFFIVFDSLREDKVLNNYKNKDLIFFLKEIREE